VRTLISSSLCRLAFALALSFPALAPAQGGDVFSKERLDQLTAQVALYPDALLSQVLMAATYPADVAEAAKWSRAHADQKGDDAVKMVENEPWDPSVRSLVAFPQVIIMMGEKPDWVKDLGDAFLAQPDALMDSVQRLRVAARNAGNLQSNEQVTVNVETSPPPDYVVEAAAPPPPPQVIVIEQRSPEVIYVPSYNPAYVYGPWLWPAYPPYYIPYPPGYWFSSAVATGIAWGIGIGVRNAVWGGCNWWGHDVNINVNRYNNLNVNHRIDRTNVNNTRWAHNVDNRRNVPYRGGDATRQNLDRRAQAVNRDQYRGRDADRQRAQQSLQNRGISTDRAALRDVNRDQLRQQGQAMDRSAMQNRAPGGRSQRVAGPPRHGRSGPACRSRCDAGPWRQSQRGIPGRRRSPGRLRDQPRRIEPAVDAADAAAERWWSRRLADAVGRGRRRADAFGRRRRCAGWRWRTGGWRWRWPWWWWRRWRTALTRSTRT